MKRTVRLRTTAPLSEYFDYLRDYSIAGDTLIGTATTGNTWIITHLATKTGIGCIPG